MRKKWKIIEGRVIDKTSKICRVGLLTLCYARILVLISTSVYVLDFFLQKVEFLKIYVCLSVCGFYVFLRIAF